MASEFYGLQNSYELANSDGAGLLRGDFYCPPDDVTRGVTLNTWPGDLAAFGSEDLTAEAAGFCKKPLSNAASGSSSVLKFAGASAPRQLPAEGVQDSSIRVDSQATAADVSNILYRYATEEVQSQNVKTNEQKYTLKADISHPELGTCTVKVYVYSTEPQADVPCGLIVEFQRRSGDAIAFNRIFRHASTYLHRELGSWMGSVPEMERDLVCPAGAAEKTIEADGGPLLDVLANGALSVQMEAAVALSAMVAVNTVLAASVYASLSELPTLHELQSHVLACASTHRADFVPMYTTP